MSKHDRILFKLFSGILLIIISVLGMMNVPDLEMQIVYIATGLLGVTLLSSLKFTRK